MGKKIYVVTDGEYSSYSIYGVFSTKNKAQQFANNGCFCCERTGGAAVEEWELDAMAGACKRLNYRYSLPSGASWTFEVNAKPGVRTPKPSSTLFTTGPQGPQVYGDSFVNAAHAKKIAEEAMQAHLRTKVTT